MIGGMFFVALFSWKIFFKTKVDKGLDTWYIIIVDKYYTWSETSRSTRFSPDQHKCCRWLVPDSL